ncbi:MAG: hypothetical protein ABI963_10255, partial [Rhizomicrobium sp.]
MNKVISGAALLAALLTVAAVMPAEAAGKICLQTRNIKDSTPKDDGTAITFKMNDGSVWRNDLKGRCPDLKYNGFAWTIRNPSGTVCENEETIEVIRSGEICALGKFTQIEPSRMEKHA